LTIPENCRASGDIYTRNTGCAYSPDSPKRAIPHIRDNPTGSWWGRSCHYRDFLRGRCVNKETGEVCKDIGDFTANRCKKIADGTDPARRVNSTAMAGKANGTAPSWLLHPARPRRPVVIFDPDRPCTLAGEIRTRYGCCNTVGSRNDFACLDLPKEWRTSSSSRSIDPIDPIERISLTARGVAGSVTGPGVVWYQPDLSIGRNGYRDPQYYQCFRGPAANFPGFRNWMSFSDMFRLNQGTMLQSEDAAIVACIRDSILQVSRNATVDARLILAIIMQAVRPPVANCHISSC